jgi:hypothetical protein
MLAVFYEIINTTNNVLIIYVLWYNQHTVLTVQLCLRLVILFWAHILVTNLADSKIVIIHRLWSEIFLASPTYYYLWD